MQGEIPAFVCPDIPETNHAPLELGFNLMSISDPKILEREILSRIDERPGYENVAKAIQFASEAHKGQKRKEGKPYIIHPLRVAIRLMQFRQITTGQLPTPDDLCIALLHDTLEDTELSEGKIRDEFGINVRAGVKKLTKKYRHGKIKGKKPREYFEGIAGSSENIQIIKVLDRIDNVDSLFYLKRNPNNPFFIQKQLRETRRYVVPIAQRYPILCHDLQTAMNRVGTSRRHAKQA
jgi:GTP pyrophosphokinase